MLTPHDTDPTPPTAGDRETTRADAETRPTDRETTRADAETVPAGGGRQ